MKKVCEEPILLELSPMYNTNPSIPRDKTFGNLSETY